MAKLSQAERGRLVPTLSSNGIGWTYNFYFLSPEDYSAFFQAVRDGNWNWKSQLMQQLEGEKA